MCIRSFRAAFLPLAFAALPGAFAAPPGAPVVDVTMPDLNALYAQALDAAGRAAPMHDMLAELDLDFEVDESALAFVGSEFGAARDIVKNAPYQAQAVNESVQVLQDGNRIVRRNTTLLAQALALDAGDAAAGAA